MDLNLVKVRGVLGRLLPKGLQLLVTKTGRPDLEFDVVHLHLRCYFIYDRWNALELALCRLEHSLYYST
jgi:hypothetical protein